MRKKIQLVLASIIIFVFGFLLAAKSQAETCWTGSCKAACSEAEEVSTTVGDGCGGGEVCCVAKPAAAVNPCADLVAGADCIMSDGKTAGTCQSGFCGTKKASTPTGGSGSGWAEGGYSSSRVATPSAGATTGWSSASLAQFGLPWTDIMTILLGILDWLLTIIGVIAVIAFVISGIQYFMVASDEKMAERAKKTMTSAIIGLIVALSGLIVTYAVDSMLNAGFLF